MADRRTLTRIVAMACAVIAISAVANAQTVDQGFDPGVSGSRVWSLALQQDGKILVAGDFTGMGGGTGTTPRQNLGRVNADGSLDESFDPSPNGNVLALALQPDGKILIGGEFTDLLSQGVHVSRNRLARLNADGTVDESFNPGANDPVYEMALQPDGKILVGGWFTGLGGGTGTTTLPHLGRLNADGSLDESFTPASPDRDVWHVALQADGKILVGGNFEHLGTEASFRFGRLNSDGSLDAAFSAARDWAFSAPDEVWSMAVQADGKIMLGLRNRILRLNSNGSLDGTFGVVDTGSYGATAIVVQPNGRIVVGGWFMALGRRESIMYPRRNLARLMEDGSIDHSFNPGVQGFYWYSPPSLVQAVVAQPDGRLVVGGHFAGLGGGTGTTPRLSLGRLLDDTTDAPFVAVQPSDQLVFAGAPATFHCEAFGFPEPTVHWIVRTGDGEWVDVPGATAATLTFTVTLADHGKQFRAVFSNSTGVAMSDVATLSVSATGVPAVIDPEFTTGLPNGAYVDEIVVQPDGKILVLGAFDVIGESGAPVPRQGIARLNSDGSVDMAFNPATYGSGSAAALQADGKYVIAGGFVFQGNIARDGIARLHADGSVDLGFNPGTDDGGIGALAIQPDGKIVVGGTFRGLGGGTGATPRDRIGRINPDGSVDAAFNPGADLQVLCIALQPDGRILIGGQFTYVAGVQRPGLARLNADGSLDTSFNAHLAPDGRQQVAHVVVQPDGRIVVGGGFHQIGGVPRNHIARLNADGSLDTGFDPGANDYVSRLLLQPDGKIIAAGSFTAFGGGGTGTWVRERIARVNPDGTLDALRAGADGYVRALAQQADWGLLVGGDFTRLNTDTVTLERRDLGRFLIGAAPTAAPSVRTQPANQSVTAGLTASFYADARGNPVPSAQWQVSIDNGVTWKPIPGATATTYAFTAAVADSGRQYRAIFANDLGQATTNAASLTVNPAIAPAVTAHPISVSTRPGLRVTFSAAGTGDPPPAVRWQVSTNGGGSWADVPAVPAATALAYSLTAALSDNGKWFRAVFTSIAGEAVTDSATLTVRRLPIPADFDGDGRTDVAVYRRETGVWFIGQQRWVQYGGPGYLPVPADFDGDGTTDIAVYQPSTGWWYVLGQTWVQFGHPGDVPVPGDYDGDGRADIAVYRPSTGEWFVRGQLHVQYGGPGYVPVPADYDGDLKTDIAVYRPAAGVWYVRDRFFMTLGEPGLDIPVPGDFNGDYVADFATYRPSTGWLQARSRTALLFAFTYGAPGDIPVAGNFDADADTDVAVYRPSSGHWFVRNQFTLQFGDAMDIPVPLNISLLSAVNGDYDGDRATDLAVYTAATGRWRVQNGADVVFGEPADKPVPADYDGNGSIDVAVRRPSTGTWYVRDQFTVEFGEASDIPVPGDYDGDGLAEVAVYRPSTGFWYFHNQPAVHFGDSGDIPVPGDYNGDGATEIAVYRPSTGYWYVRSQVAVQRGGPGLVPVPGDYNGDGLTDVAVFDTATATWHIRGYPAIVFGDPTDTPVPGDYDGDGTTDIAVYTPATGTWNVLNQFTIVFGDPGDVPVVRSGGNR